MEAQAAQSTLEMSMGSIQFILSTVAAPAIMIFIQALKNMNLITKENTLMIVALIGLAVGLVIGFSLFNGLFLIVISSLMGIIVSGGGAVGIYEVAKSKKSGDDLI